MKFVRHGFTKLIIEILDNYFPGESNEVMNNSELLQYINIKTKAANRGAKTRAAYANHYAIYVLVEDYIKHGFHNRDDYNSYEGAMYKNLFNRQRELPFGSKLQNHALNHRLNQEFKKYFPTIPLLPIIRDAETNRYWINEKLLRLSINDVTINIAEPIIKIIDSYIKARQKAFDEFMEYCQEMICIQKEKPERAVAFIKGLLNPNIDARVFEIVSYAILKQRYADQFIYWGWSPDELNIEALTLYKTGRTNANDGGIDFVMRPLGRFFQVTETIDAGKYFLDIDKVQRYPITFVVKSEQSNAEILNKVEDQARAKYGVEAIVQRYMHSVEEIINIRLLLKYFEDVLEKGKGPEVIDEIVLQSRVEFNVEAEEQDVLAYDNAVMQEEEYMNDEEE